MTEEGNDDMPDEDLSAKQAAIQLGISAREFRKFMRATTPRDEQPGQGNRYHIDAGDIKALKKRYAEWNTPKRTEVPVPDAPKPKAKKAKATKAKAKKTKSETPEPGDDHGEDLILDEDISLD
jgi:hypothetical protein